MAPLPENTTARLFLDYTSFAIQHTLLARPVAGTTILALEALATALATVMASRMFIGDSVFGARYSAALTNFSLPITFTPVGGVIESSGNSWAEDPEAAFISLCGRSTSSGRMVRWEQFTAVKSAAWPADNRYQPGESAPVDTWRLNMVDIISGSEVEGVELVAIDGTSVQVYNYVNIAKNAYWQRKQRVG